MGVNRFIRKNLFNRRVFIRLVFNVNVITEPSRQSYCEWQSILLRLILKRYITPDCKVFDVGTGAHALISIYSKKQFQDIKILATDIVPERVEWAQKTAEENDVDIECRVVDMYDGINDKFDLLLINPPAIPSSELEKLGYELCEYPGIGVRRCWTGDGGSDGLDVIRRFLNGAAEHLTDKGRVIMTVNPMHCSTDTVFELCRNAGLKIERIHKIPVVTNGYVASAESTLIND